MKFAIFTALLLLFFGTPAFSDARQEKGQEEHSEAGKPAAKPEKPAPKPQSEKPVDRQQTPVAKHEEHPTTSKPTEDQAKTPQHAHSAAPSEPNSHAASHVQPSNETRTVSHSTQPHSVATNKGNSSHGRISEAHYTASFGSQHRFHVNQSDYQRRRFSYGGYSFGFIDPWPVGWAYSDDVYIVYVDGGYYMYDPFHPGVRIAVNIF
jgi:hypothetical protein